MMNDEAYPCPSCGLMITDPVLHHRFSGCRRRDAEKCPHCGLMKLRGVEHRCQVIQAMQREEAAYDLAKAKARAARREGLKYPAGHIIGVGKTN